MPDALLQPVQTLREHTTALEAALLVCLADSDKRSVHKLRTETRRVEAQIELLKRVPGLPRFRAEAAKLLRQAGKVRRAAGRVRDFDVQHKLLKQHGAEVTGGGEDTTGHQKQMEELLAAQEEHRKSAASKLLAVLTKRQRKLASALEALHRSLKAAAEQTVPVAEMLTAVERGFRSTAALHLKHPGEEDLHDIRKAAKRARYQAETAPDSPAAREVATRFEEVQEAGGQWHDWHDLAAMAAHELGRRHSIAAAFAAQRDQRLAVYRQLLSERVPAQASGRRKLKGRVGMEPIAKQEPHEADSHGSQRALQKGPEAGSGTAPKGVVRVLSAAVRKDLGKTVSGRSSRASSESGKRRQAGATNAAVRSRKVSASASTKASSSAADASVTGKTSTSGDRAR